MQPYLTLAVEVYAVPKPESPLWLYTNGKGIHIHTNQFNLTTITISIQRFNKNVAIPAYMTIFSTRDFLIDQTVTVLFSNQFGNQSETFVVTQNGMFELD